MLIKFPTRSRLGKSLDTLKRYIDLADEPDRLQIVVSLDSDDVACCQNAWRFRALHKNVTVCIGPPEGKIAAVNRDLPNDFDILVLASDDMIPQVKGYDTVIRERMAQFFPDGDGVLFFNDGYCGPQLNTLVICGQAYYARFGYVYFPGYRSLFCDNEFMDEANRLGKQVYFNDVIIRHEHPINTRASPDALYKKNDVAAELDHALYCQRWKPQYDLSILICTVPQRQSLLQTLLQDIEAMKRGRVQVLIDLSDLSIGAKRNALLARAQGRYSAFVDDDDKITPDYFQVLEEALAGDYDCIALNGRYYVNGRYNAPFYHSMAYNQWTQDSKAFYRPPNHLNPIKTQLARRIRFQEINYLEDRDFSFRLMQSGLIKTEYAHDKTQYLYFKTTEPASVIHSILKA